ncbi:polyprenyl synthetase family protein [uncultured Phycicoccus sp.]|uniref:polyprenyl synthetase family protein n=1 Tax=uncultured Phycicoccus sp. TaxID=661422 RepID=UPI00261100A9|nr:polyprenyl synthetase family protein [uncultured Phycicoccus sp.]
MSAEVTAFEVHTRPGPLRAEDTLDGVDSMLDEALESLGGLLEEAGVHPAGGDAATGPLHVDLVRELGGQLANPGKRIRPRLAHWGWALAGDADATTWPSLVRVGAALELLHLFALVQDDVMDRSDTRRGRTALHVQAGRRHRSAEGLGDAALFGDSVAVLVADLALSEAASLVAPLPAPVRRVWRLMTVELVDGQLLDITHTASRGRDVPTSRRIARFKSGRYTITRPLELGAAVSGADRAHIDRLVAWGDLVGDAFAVRDDVLGVWGDPAVTGKPAGDDLASGKPTILLSWAHEMLPAGDRPLLAACDAGTLDADGVRALQAAMAAAGVRERAEQEITGLAERALDGLPELGGDAAAVTALDDLVRSIAWRSA